ncbi:MAG: phosphoadenylyl-sulfate reductase [Acidobacteriota bacterium]
MSPEPPPQDAPPVKGTGSTREPDEVATLAADLESIARDATVAAVRRVLVRAFKALAPRDAVFTSGLGMEGCALLAIAAPLGLPLRIVFLDTGFHFPETLELFETLQRRYPALAFESVRPARTPTEQAEQEGDALWRRDPDRCCHLRKIEPLTESLRGADLWISAIGRSQSPARAEQPILTADSRFGPPKLSPLAAWRRADVWRFVSENELPFHPLHLSGYPSISCHHCTLPVPDLAPGEYSRAGRWSESAKTECGLHVPVEPTRNRGARSSPNA